MAATAEGEDETVTERPNTVLGFLVSAAVAVAALIVAALAALGVAGVMALVITAVGVLTVCIFFLYELHQLPPASVLLAALVVVSDIAFLRALLSYIRERRLLACLPLERVERGPLFEVARLAGVDRLYLAPASRPAAFCFGLMQPKVVITRGLLTRLSPAEQAAVVWHEGHHACNCRRPSTKMSTSPVRSASRSRRWTSRRRACSTGAGR
jgi:Zn-dependent protease with chaperone function